MSELHDNELTSLESQLRDALPALGAIEPANDFNDRLHQRWMQRQERRAGGNALRRWATAAVILLALGAATMLLTTTPTQQIAWADVVAAVQAAPNFHMIAFIDDPFNADESHRMMRLDLFYERPDRWRAHGLGMVQFGVGPEARVYSVEKRAFLEPGARRYFLIPDGFPEQLPKRGLMGALLHTMFRGKPPVGEPVHSDVAAEQAGIAVFDYAHDASQTWARIWVLRDSKLPIRAQITYPDSDETVMVNFDYSDPQPAAFFDADAFAALAVGLNNRSPQRFYLLGTAPVTDTKPRGSSQINTVKGGYRQPAIKRALANERGDVLLITDNPTNRDANGQNPSEHYDYIRDNWGNTYVGAGSSTPCCGEDVDRKHYLAPLPPFVTGEGPRQLTLTYIIDHPGRTPDATFEPVTVDVPAPTPMDKTWDVSYFESQRDAVIRSEMQRTTPLARQLGAIDDELAADPESLGANIWLIQLMRKHDREEQAWSLFEAQVRDRIIPKQGDLSLGHNADVLLAQYLIHLYASGRDAEADAIVARLEDYRRWASGVDKRNLIYIRAEAMFDPREHNLLMQAMRTNEWRALAGRGVEVKQVLRDSHGNVVVQMHAPPQPAGWSWTGQMGGSGFHVDSGWFWDVRLNEGWRVQGRMIDKDTGEFWVALQGEGESLTLRGTITIAQDNHGRGHARNVVTRDWSVTAPLPVQANVDDLEQWWAKETADRNAERWYRYAAPQGAAPPSKTPVQQMEDEVSAFVEAGDVARARELLQKIADAPEDQWPSWFVGDNVLPGTLAMQRWSARLRAAKLLAESDDPAQAWDELDRLGGELPQPIDYADRIQAEQAAALTTTRVAVLRAWFEAGDREAVMQRMQRMSDERPDPATIPDGYEEVIYLDGKGRTMWYPRNVTLDAWRPFDTLWWDLRDAATQPAGD